MPSKKQRKRDQKLRRHEYEEVWVDDAGHEIEPPPSTEKPPQDTVRTAKAGAPKPAQRPGGRTPQPPSWQRAGMRAIYFAPVAFLLAYFLQKSDSRSTLAAAVQAIILMVLMIPGFYAMDRIGWKAWERRTGGQKKPPGRPKKS